MTAIQSDSTTPQPAPTTWRDPTTPARQHLTAQDLTTLLTMHALAVFGLILVAPLAATTPDARVFFDLSLVALIATPGILMAAFDTPGRTGWTTAGTLVSIAYLWLPNAALGSIYAHAEPLSIGAIVLLTPILNVIAPLILLGRSRADSVTLVWYGLAAILAPSAVYAALVYPMTL